MSTTLKDRLSHVTGAVPIGELPGAARNAGAVVARTTSRAGEKASSAASATRGAGANLAHRVSDASMPTLKVGQTAGRAAGKAVEVSGRAGRRIEKARGAAELSAERARAATELRVTKSRSRRALRGEAKARERADHAQAVLTNRLTKAERKLAAVHRRRRRGLAALLLVTAGASAALAVRRFLQAAEEASPLGSGPASTPLGTGGTGPYRTGYPESGARGEGGPTDVTPGTVEVPGVDTVGGPSLRRH